ncbi:AAA family ATPase [Sinomonas sp. P47F7]|uniref:AAA family ATPase n=1 Tax=Sinomonas sp. P47F7 TaxID=3410987 RepID=UPI003BF56E6E
MRLHRLEIEAFGPFASRQSVDFDALAEHGLFLLNGATGAGKTSVLDAVCFALYGGLPGARQGSKSLKSHHADAGAQPEAVLEFSAQGRRFEVRRTPAWERPSARAKNGFTTQQASTHLRELVGGEWQALSSRNDEASDVLRGVLGMDREQFTRVAMLPQGEFAAFLRADPKEREKLLESLFSTGRFGEIEAQLAAMAQDAEARAAKSELTARLLVRQLEAELAAPEPNGFFAGSIPDVAAEPEPCGAGPVPGASPVDDAGPLDGGAVEVRFAWAIDRLAGLAERAGAEIAAARDGVSLARSAEEACRRAVDDAAELASARERRARWEADAPLHAERVERLDRAAAAGALRPELDGERRAAAATLEAEEEFGDAFGVAVAAGWEGPTSREPSPGELRSEAGDARSQAAVLEEQTPLEEAFEQLKAEHTESVSEAGRQRGAVARLDLELAELARSADHLTAERARLESIAALGPGAERDFDAATGVLDAVKDFVEAAARRAAAHERHGELREAAVSLRSEWLDLREERLAHTAYELAAGLESGAPCPVCGSADHPHPAVGDEDPLRLVDRERGAADAAERAAEREQAAASALAEAQSAVAAATARGGDADPEKAARGADEAGAALRLAREAQTQLVAAARRLETLDVRRRAAAAEREAASTSLALAESTSARLEREVERRRVDLERWREGWGSLRARHAALTAIVRALEPLADAAARAVGERARLTEAEGELSRALSGSPFADASAARAALLDEAEAAMLRRAVDGHRAEERTIEGLLSSAASVRALEAEKAVAEHAVAEQAVPVQAVTELAITELAAGTAGPPSAGHLAARLAACRDDLRRAEARLAAAQTAEHSARASQARCERLRGDFSAALPALTSDRAERELLDELQRTARGSGENRLRMSLHRYVLAARLEQVAVAASERLDVMSDGRFSLEHTDALAARGAASGLGLEIMDAWTGQRRDPATLSGGESFMASLALALGLADVVQHESGGVDIETLFVDEGFGSLDEQTLEQVMEAIEGLRDGGRTVGLVSHVPELKQRIPAQIRVTKGRSGSSLEVVAGGDAV